MGKRSHSFFLGAFGYEDFSLNAGESHSINQTYNVVFITGGEDNIAMLAVSSYRGIAVLNGNYDQNSVTITNEVGYLKITNNTNSKMNNMRAYIIKHT